MSEKRTDREILSTATPRELQALDEVRGSDCSLYYLREYVKELTAPRPTEGDAATADKLAAKILMGVASGKWGEHTISGFLAAALSAARADERGPFQTKIAELQKEIRSLEARVWELGDGAREFLDLLPTLNANAKGISITIRDIDPITEARNRLRALLGDGEDGKG